MKNWHLPRLRVRWAFERRASDCRGGDVVQTLAKDVRRPYDVQSIERVGPAIELRLMERHGGGWQAPVQRPRQVVVASSNFHMFRSARLAYRGSLIYQRVGFKILLMWIKLQRKCSSRFLFLKCGGGLQWKLMQLLRKCNIISTGWK